MGVVYGYARISTRKQKITRQIKNILSQYPDAIIYEEAFTGVTTDRPKFKQLLRKVKTGDMIVFDEVSRMSRNAQEGFDLYQQLYCSGVDLVFLKEPYINTCIYRMATQRQIDTTIDTGNASTDKLTKAILKALSDFQMDLAREQIKAAFDTAQSEIDYLHKRTREGISIAKANGKQIGRTKGAAVVTKKNKESKVIIRKHCRDFGGELTDAEVQKLCGISRNTYYKYKRQIKEEASG